MKGIYNRVPSREDVVKQVKIICKSLGVEAPAVKFHEQAINSCQEDHLLLMDPDWAVANDGPIQNMRWPVTLNHRYWESVLHEIAHWYTFNSGNADDVDHRPEMYAVLLGLMLREGIPLDAVWWSESRYRPSALARGSKLVGNMVLENFMGRSLVNREAHKAKIVPFPTPDQEAAI